MKPVIRVSCLPKESQERLEELFRSIVAAVESITELGLKGESSMVVLFPPDMMLYGLGREIVIEVIGLQKTTGLDLEVRNHLAELLGRTLRTHLPTAMVQCFVHPPFDPDQGYWTNPRRIGRSRKPFYSETRARYGLR